MLKVESVVKVVLTDDKGQEVHLGATVVYRDKTNRDFVAVFEGLEKSLLAFRTLTTGVVYKVRLGSVDYIQVIALSL